MKTIAALSLFAILVAAYVSAAETEVTATAEVPEETPATAATWLELQRSGSQASAQAQPLSAPVMNKIHERYVNSFARPIPETFKHEAFR
jgi:hypothetical protein